MSNEIIPVEIIENKIYIIREHKVMLDSDLADLYGVETRIINRNVNRSIERFPEDFMFQLTEEEWKSLRFQIGISMEGKGGRRYNPYAFTEYGVLMLSSVLNSKRAIAVNIQIMRIFVKLRQMALVHKDLAYQLQELEQRFISYAKGTTIELNEHKQKIKEIFKQLDHLRDITKPSQIGFNVD